MNTTNAVERERAIEVREIGPRIRHTLIFQLFEHLDDLSELQLVADRDPRALAPPTRSETRQSLQMDLSQTRPRPLARQAAVRSSANGDPKERVMISKGNEVDQIWLFEENEREYFKSLIRSEYERYHPDETLEDLKRRSRFSKEDKGPLRDWMALAMQRAITSRDGKPVIDLNMAA